MKYNIVVTSTIADHLNSNSIIRDYFSEAAINILGAENVHSSPLEISASLIKHHTPNLVVAIGSIASDTADLRLLRRQADAVGALLVYWLHDDPYEFDYAFKAEQTADVIFSNDAWAVHHYRHPEVYHLPLAASKRIHRRDLKPIESRELSVFFCGVAYSNRINIIRKAEAIVSIHPVAILGAQWPPDIKCAQNRRLSQQEMADYAQNSRLTLNIGRDLDIANRRYALPASTPGPRTFEIALAGSAQLYFAASLEILDYFENGTEILLFDAIKDIEAAITMAYDDPARLYSIASKAQERALRDHTYESRVRTMLSICGKHWSMSAAVS